MMRESFSGAPAHSEAREENPIYWSLMAVAFMNTALSRLIDSQAVALRKVSGGVSASGGRSVPAAVSDVSRKICRVLAEISQIHMAQLLRFQDIFETAGPDGQVFSHTADGYRRPAVCLPEKPSAGAEIQPSADAGRLPGVRGRLQGIVTRREDPFAGGTAILQAVISQEDSVGVPGREIGNFLCYSVMRDDILLMLMARPGESGGFSVSQADGTLRVEGEGTVVRKERARPDLRGCGRFVLTVRREEEGERFTMGFDGGQEQLVHRSGEMAAVRTPIPFHY